jgi:APA family basic amino acid/polyamine antiporter
MEQNVVKTGHKIGLWGAVALVIGNMIGSGVFLLPATLAPLGWNAVIGWVVSIGGSVLLALSIALLARKVSGCGGLICMLEEAFGPLAATVLGWSAWVGFWTGIATLAVAAVSYLSLWAPILAEYSAFFASLLVWMVTLISLTGLKQASIFQGVTTVLKVIPLIIVLGLTLWLFTVNSEPVAVMPVDAVPITITAIGGAVALTLWAMVGFEAAALAEDAIDNPYRNVALSTVIGTTLTGLLYLVVVSAIQLLSNTQELANSNAPFVYFIEAFWPDGPGPIIGLFAAISAIGALNGWTIITGEVPRSMARKGILPQWFAGSSANGAPRNALLIGATCATVMLMFNASKSTGGLFAFMALLSTCASLWVYVSCAAATIKYRLSYVVAPLGLIFGIWAIWSAGRWEAGLSLLLLLLGFPVYWLIHRHKGKTASAE